MGRGHTYKYSIKYCFVNSGLCGSMMVGECWIIFNTVAMNVATKITERSLRLLSSVAMRRVRTYFAVIVDDGTCLTQSLFSSVHCFGLSAKVSCAPLYYAHYDKIGRYMNTTTHPHNMSTLHTCSAEHVIIELFIIL